MTSSAETAVIALKSRINERGELKVTTTSPVNLDALPTLEDRFFAHFADSHGWTTEFILFSETRGRDTAGSLHLVDVAAVSTTAGERGVLEALYYATGGPNWTNNDNWLTDVPLGEWYGVSVDGQGRVDGLRLNRNNLDGSIPRELGNLVNLRELEVFSNDLTGPIPPELGNLANLQVLQLSSNKLTGPIPAELGNLSNLYFLGLSFNGGMGQIPPELGNLVNLNHLSAQNTGLSGSIPPELGKLANLQGLLLGYGSNALTGPIPPELGGLTSLRMLDLWGNDLAGSIPRELGELSQLESLELSLNNLTGPIPPELGKLSNLDRLWLHSNNLSGRIPPELGNLTNLLRLHLVSNNLAGPLPPELGKLTSLEFLGLSENDLTGPIPSEFGGMSSLRELSIGNNSGMSGPLPAGLTVLDHLEALLAGGTGLCAPSDPEFQGWLEGVVKYRIAPCVAGDPPAAYLTQAVQSQEFPVPLVAGETALLRVFPIARQATNTGVPAVRARFYVDGREAHVADIQAKPTPIPTDVDESSLSKSANAEIPGHVAQPGLEMVIEIEPDGTLDPGLGVARRIPETGRLAVEVKDMPVFHLTVIPFLWSPKPDSLVLEITGAMAEDPHGHELLEMTRTLLPMEDIVVIAHEPVVTSSNNAVALARETEAIRVLEGGRGYYLGTMTGEFEGNSVGRAAGLPGRSIFSKVDLGNRSEYVIAHELGHNMSLRHTPGCEAGGPDHDFPYEGGSIGVWGYDFAGERLVPPIVGDLMSYCPWNWDKPWISDYHFTNALRYRLVEEGGTGTYAAGPPRKSMLLWGGVDADGAVFLEPALMVDATASLPSSTGDYRIAGRTADGAELFSLAFEMPEVADGDGESSFAFVVPVESGWAQQLAGIDLSGPAGAVTLDENTDRPVTIQRDSATGQVRGILRGRPEAAAPGTAAYAFPLEPGVEVWTSLGLPDAAEWSR